MTKLMIDPALQAKLDRNLEFTDEAGQTVGFFVTPDEFEQWIEEEAEQRRLDYEYARAAITDEDLARAKASGGEYTYEQVMEHLRSLGDSEQAKSA